MSEFMSDFVSRDGEILQPLFMIERFGIRETVAALQL